MRFLLQLLCFLCLGIRPCSSLRTMVTTSNTTSTAPSVCVIGAGPGGLFFSHAVETKRRQDPDNPNLPSVTCFERAPAAGGVWRSERTFASSAVQEEKKEPDVPMPALTNMYEALWTNGPKENIEFFDYTFQDHFGDHPLPVYMPRQPLLEYMIARVTKNCPDFFNKYFQFNTSVESVTYIESKSKFKIVTRNVFSGEETMHEFDYCIWSGGENGKPMIPQKLVNLFQNGGFAGRIIHSTETANFEDDTRDKRVLIIGGNYSAEDLALMAIKVGAEKVYISSRDQANAVHWTGSWPENKVTVLAEQIPVGVTENGKSIQFASTKYAPPGEHVESDLVQTEVRDIDTIIFCTGYLPNSSFLDEELSKPLLSKYDKKATLSVPKDWKMTPNEFTEKLGDVEPGTVSWYESAVTYPDMYRGLSIFNTRMMYITAEVDNPMTGIDVRSWHLLQFITGECKVPSRENMIESNERDALILLNNPYWRAYMDSEYHEAIKATYNESLEEIFNDEYEDKADDIYSRFLARSAREAGYPVDFGSLEDLSSRSKRILEYDELSWYHRKNLTANDAGEKRTFRDYKDGHKFQSFYSGAKSVELKKLWLYMDADDPSILES